MALDNRDTYELFKMLFAVARELENRRIEASERISYLDSEISNIYHKIETEAFNARDGYKLSKRLQKILQYRRIVKRDIHIFNYLKCSTSKFDWANFINEIKLVDQVSMFTETEYKNNNQWSNYNKLGRVPYKEVVEYCDKSHGKLEDKMKYLELVITKSKQAKYNKAISK